VRTVLSHFIQEPTMSNSLSNSLSSSLSLPVFARRFVAGDAAAANRAAEVDLPGSRIGIETDRGLVTAFYIDAKPRRDAIVIPLGAGNWNGGAPTPEATRHARLLLDNGVTVLLVDVRWYEGWRGRLLGRPYGAVMRGALDYLVARGHDEADCTVDGWSKAAEATACARP
jgi:hypothetical protein